MELNDKLKIVFKNPDGKKETLKITVKELLENTLDDFYEMLDDKNPCNSAGCNNEGQNFCDCGSSYDDYEFYEILPLC